MNRGPYVLTLTGRKFHPGDPRVEDVDPVDVAAGLAAACRFHGQLPRFYSVAEHCVHASHLVAPELALEALLHDAEEAYPPGDIPTPVKLMPEAAPLLALQARIRGVVRERFGIRLEDSPQVKQVDRELFAIESRSLRVKLPEDYWRSGRTPNAYDAWREGSMRVVPLCWSPDEAFRSWLYRFQELSDEWVRTDLVLQ